MEFEIIKVSKACLRQPMYSSLMVGDKVAIRCDLEALKKDSVESESSNRGGVDDEAIDPAKNSVLDYQDDAPYTSKVHRMKKQQRPESKFRCRGEGAPGRTSRFSALAAPSCHGKWSRLPVEPSSKCSEFQFIFV